MDSVVMAVTAHRSVMRLVNSDAWQTDRQETPGLLSRFCFAEAVPACEAALPDQVIDMAGVAQVELP